MRRLSSIDQSDYLVSHSLHSRRHADALFPLNRESCVGASCLLLLLITALLTLLALLGGLGLLSPHTTWASTTEWRSESEVDVLLRVETDDERWDVDDLLADTK